MFEVFLAIGKYAYATLGAIFIPFILGYVIKKIETDSITKALVAALIISGISVVSLFLLTTFAGGYIGGPVGGALMWTFSNALVLLVMAIVMTAGLTWSFYNQESESLGRNIISIVLPLAVYMVGYMIMIPITFSFVITLFYLIASFYLITRSGEDLPSQFMAILIASMISFIFPLLRGFTIATLEKLDLLIASYTNVEITIGLITFPIAYIVASVFLSRHVNPWVLVILGIAGLLSFFIIPPGLTPEARLAVETSTKTAQKHLELYQKYLQLYRQIQQNETLRKMYEAGTYEYPEKGSLIFEPHKGIIIDVNEEKTIKFWNRKDHTAFIEIYGEIENPLETPLQVLIRLSNVNIKGITEDTEITLSKYTWTCNFMKSELTKEEKDSTLDNINDDKRGDIEVIHKQSFEPFTCRLNILHIPSNVRKIIVSFSVDAYYRVFSSAIVELHFMGSNKYMSLWRAEKLQQRRITSVSTWGPLQGVIFIGGMAGDFNPIRVEKTSDIILKVYTKKEVIDGLTDMDCYIIALPNIPNKFELDLNSVKNPLVKCKVITPEKGSSFSKGNCYDYIANLTKEIALFYGYTVYNEYFDKLLKEGYNIVECDFGSLFNDFSHQGNPANQNETVILRAKVNLRDNEELIVFPQAHFIYTFKQFYDVSPITILPG